MEITATLVSELRAATGAPLMKCKAALVETGGDLERAQEVLDMAPPNAKNADIDSRDLG